MAISSFQGETSKSFKLLTIHLGFWPFSLSFLTFPQFPQWLSLIQQKKEDRGVDVGIIKHLQMASCVEWTWKEHRVFIPYKVTFVESTSSALNLGAMTLSCNSGMLIYFLSFSICKHFKNKWHTLHKALRHILIIHAYKMAWAIKWKFVPSKFHGPDQLYLRFRVFPTRFNGGDPLSSLTYSHLSIQSGITLCMSLEWCVICIHGSTKCFWEDALAIKGNDLYAKVTCLGLILVLFGMVEIHFHIYLGNGWGEDDVQWRGRGILRWTRHCDSWVHMIKAIEFKNIKKLPNLIFADDQDSEEILSL